MNYISAHNYPLYARIMGNCVLIIITQSNIDLNTKLNCVILLLCDSVIINHLNYCTLIVLSFSYCVMIIEGLKQESHDEQSKDW